MKKGTKWLFGIGGLLLMLYMVALLVGGKTYKMYTANRLFASPEPEKQEKALQLYQDLAVDLPASPHVRHNLGLAYHAAGHWPEALTEYQKVESEFAKGDRRGEKELIFKHHYHFGSALFAQAEALPPEEAAGCYEQALSHFTAAIRNDQTDQAAKYNYELTKLRLEALTQQPNERQEKTDPKQGEEETPEQSPEEAYAGTDQEKENKPALPEEEEPPSAPLPPEGMSKEEAEALLQMAEAGEAYQAPMIISTPAPPGKDW